MLPRPSVLISSSVKRARQIPNLLQLAVLGGRVTWFRSSSHVRYSAVSSSRMAPPESASGFIDFLNSSPSPYHAVASATRLLEGAGFVKFHERDNWAEELQPGGKYYVTRNGSSIVAFAVGAKWRPGGPVGIVAAHTDSPCLRVKPVSNKTANGFLQVGVETYGGGIWHSWFDRDLSLAGRVLVRDAAAGTFEQRLVKIDRPLLRIPNLAIHLHRNPEFNPNTENELFPIVGLMSSELNGPSGGDAKMSGVEGEAKAVGDQGEFQSLKTVSERHHPAVIDVIAEHVGAAASDVMDFELVLYDTQKASLGGLRDEFIFGPRLDNLCMTYCSVMGMIASVQSASLDDDRSVRVIAGFDHEEVGSRSAQGADSNLLPAVLTRICGAFEEAGAGSGGSAALLQQTLSTSFLVSADMAHGVHPNYEAKYEARHRPEMNRGPVIKVNANQRYSTNAPGVVLMQEVAQRAGVPLQLFVVRNDSPCGSTIGPMLAAKLGMRTLDLGNPQLSMHSIRETGGSHDVEHAIRLFESFLNSYGGLESKILVD